MNIFLRITSFNTIVENNYETISHLGEITIVEGIWPWRKTTEEVILSRIDSIWRRGDTGKKVPYNTRGLEECIAIEKIQKQIAKAVSAEISSKQDNKKPEPTQTDNSLLGTTGTLTTNLIDLKHQQDLFANVKSKY